MSAQSNAPQAENLEGVNNDHAGREDHHQPTPLHPYGSAPVEKFLDALTAAGHPFVSRTWADESDGLGTGWQHTPVTGNPATLAQHPHERGHVLFAVMKPGAFAVLDVDPRNGGDLDKLRASLAAAEVPIYAEVHTGGGGRHLYITSPSRPFGDKNGTLHGFPGVDLRVNGAVFLPGTRRVKHDGAPYRLAWENLDEGMGNADDAEQFADWLDTHRPQRAAPAATTAATPALPAPRAQPEEDGTRRRLRGSLAATATRLARETTGGRNQALNDAALWFGHAADHGLTRTEVHDALRAACQHNGVLDDDGPATFEATFASGWDTGTADPWPLERILPDRGGQHSTGDLRDVLTPGTLPTTAPTPGTSATTGDADPGVKLRRFNDLTIPPPTQWVGRGWLPRREITFLVGEEGIGKSLLWVRMVAAITTGRPDPVFGIPAREPADVVLVLTEDSMAEVRARLDVAGADLARVLVFSAADDGSEPPVFGDDVHEGDMLRLRRYLAAENTTPDLLVVDAWLDTIDGRLSMRDTQQARRALKPWGHVADEFNMAVLLLGHTNRVDTGSTRDRVGGSIAVRQVARMLLMALRPPAEENGDDRADRMVVGPEKVNLGRKLPAVMLDVDVHQVRPETDDDPGTTAGLARPRPMGDTIDRLAADWHKAAKATERAPSKTDACKDAITAYMAGKDSAPVDELDKHLAGLGYGERTRKAARSAVGWSDRATFGGGYLFRLGRSPYLAGHHAVHPKPNTVQHAPHAPHAPQGTPNARAGEDTPKDDSEPQGHQGSDQPLPGMPCMPCNPDSDGPQGAPHDAPHGYPTDPHHHGRNTR